MHLLLSRGDLSLVENRWFVVSLLNNIQYTGRFIAQAIITYLFPHPPNLSNKLVGLWGIMGYGWGEACMSDTYNMTFEKSKEISQDIIIKFILI